MCLSVCVCVPESRCPSKPEASSPLELELQVVMSQMWVLEASSDHQPSLQVRAVRWHLCRGEGVPIGQTSITRKQTRGV